MRLLFSNVVTQIDTRGQRIQQAKKQSYVDSKRVTRGGGVREVCIGSLSILNTPHVFKNNKNLHRKNLM